MKTSELLPGLPTEEGFYWMFEPDMPPDVVWLSFFAGELHLFTHGSEDLIKVSKYGHCRFAKIEVPHLEQ